MIKYRDMNLDQELNKISKKLVFVVGSPRSGTTWLQRLLSSHHRVHTGHESGLFDTYIGQQLRGWQRDMNPMTSGRGIIGLGCYITEREFKDKLSAYLLDLLEPMLKGLGENDLFLEKTPSHAFYVDEILELLPNAKIIYMQRSPFDVVASLLTASMTWGSYWAPKSTKGASLMWQQHVDAVRAVIPKIPAGQYFEVRYERLFSEPQIILKELFSFVGVETDARQISEIIEANELGREGTPIYLKGEAVALSGTQLQEPEGFVRKAREQRKARNQLTFIQRLIVWFCVYKTVRREGYFK